jgi:hypothetical protein
MGSAAEQAAQKSSHVLRARDAVFAAVQAALLLALGGCSAAIWSCPPGGGVLTGAGGCRVTLIRGLTEVDLMVVADGRVLVLGSKPDAAAIAAATALAAPRLPFGGHPPVPEPKPKRRPRR